MKKDDFLKKLEKLVEHTKSEYNTLDAGEISDFFAGDNLSPEQMDQIYSYLENRNTDATPVLDEVILTRDTALPDDIDLDLGLDDDSLIKDVEEKEADSDTVDLLGGIGTENPVRMYLKEVGTASLLTADEELNLAQREADGGDYAKERLIEVSLHFVISIAGCYIKRGMSFLDLVWEDGLGLIKGVEKFDYTKGYKLSTYATWRIHQPVIRALTNQARVIRVLVYMVETINKISKMQRKLTLELGYEPFVTELAEILDMTEDETMEIMQIARRLVPLETPIGEEGDSNPSDFVIDNDVVTPKGNVKSAMLREHVDALLGGLRKRERQIIVLRFGLEDGHPRTPEETGKKFNVTRGRIRQIRTKILRRLCNPVRSG